MKHEDYQIKIDAYLQNQMTATDRQAFEIELAMNQQLAEQLKKQEIELKIMEALVERDLKKDLKKWQQETEIDTNHTEDIIKVSPKPLYRKFPFLLVAASLLFLVGLFLWTNQQKSSLPNLAETETNINKEQEQNPVNISDSKKEESPINPNKTQEKTDQKKSTPSSDPKKKPSQKDLPAKVSKPNYIALATPYLEPIDFGKIQTRDRKSNLGTALNDLQEKKFDLGNQKLLDLLQTDNKNLNATYYLGLSYFEQKKYQTAIPYLERISNATYLHSERAEWLLGLAYLQEKKNNEAITLFKRIQQDEEHIYFEKVDELLKKIANQN